MTPTNELKSNKDWALHYRAMGISVMPVKANKKPHLDSWKPFQERLPTEEQINAWWDTLPDAGIAIITGKISGLVALDFDIKHNRDSKEFPLPPTACAKSGSGGEHFFFKHPGTHVQSGVGSFGIGVDIRADGGYILVEPSVNENGKYEWIVPLEAGLADMPEWLHKKTTPDKKYLSAKNGVKEGSRNDSGASMAGKILSACPIELWDTIGWGEFENWNNKNSPPLPLTELKTIWENVKKYHINEEGEKKERAISQADRLVSLVLDNPDILLFRSELDEPFISFPVDNHREYWLSKEKKTKMWLGMEFFKLYQKSPSGDAINTAMNTIQGFAVFKGPKFDLANRVTFKDGDIFYSLSNDTWEAIRITQNGWSLEKDVPILFRRHSHQNAQVLPEKGGDLQTIFKYVNVKNEEHRIIFLVWLIACFIPGFPHPILYLYGPQGSAKSTASRLIKKIIDPSKIETFEIPKDPKELIQKLSHHWCLMFDNISQISYELSDLLCRAVTGSGVSKRELYSDDSDVIHTFRRCMSINGVNLLALKPDLLERSILIQLERVAKDERKNEQDMMKDFDAELPGLLGTILDTVASALRIRSSVELNELPRMADFALWGYAIAEALGYGGDKFIECYFRNINLQNDEVVNESTIASFVVTLMEKQGYWEGSASELLSLITFASTNIKEVPKNPQALSHQLNILKTNLEECGIIIETISGRQRKIIIRKKGENIAPIASSLFVAESDDLDDKF